MAVSASAQVDAIDRFFESYQDDEEFTMRSREMPWAAGANPC